MRLRQLHSSAVLLVFLVASCTGTQTGTTAATDNGFLTEVCEMAAELADLDVQYVQEEGFMFEKRDRIGVAIRTHLGQIRTLSYGIDDGGEIYSAVYLPTQVLERADFSESGLFTQDESAAAHELSAALDEYCSSPLSPDGLLLATPG